MKKNKRMNDIKSVARVTSYASATNSIMSISVKRAFLDAFIPIYLFYNLVLNFSQLLKNKVLIITQ